MAASIIRLEQENEELKAEVAMAEAERIELAKMLRSERQMHAQCQNERDNWRSAANQAVADRDHNKREWDKCAAELAAVLNGFDEMDAADADAESLEAAE